MLKSLKFSLSGAVFFLAFISLVTGYAADFALTKIGALDTGGSKYSEWWYTGTNPLLQGTGAASQEVTVKIADQSYKVTADANGAWSYQATLASGDYQITLTQSANSYAFTLHLGQGLPSAGTTTQTTQSTTSVPVTGYNQISAIGFGIGIALLASYFYINGGSDHKVSFEKRMLKED